MLIQITTRNIFIKKVILLFCLFSLTYASAEIEDNAAYRDAYQAWAAAHLSLLPTSFLPGPAGAVADLASIGIDIRIKTLPAKLIAPTPNTVMPNSPDGCLYSFYLPQKEATYENLLGIADIHPLPTNWGAFSDPQPPFVEHANAQVVLRVANQYLDDWTDSDHLVIFPSGQHPLQWSANTQIDPLIDVAVPVALFIITNEVKYFKSFFEVQTNPATAARAAEIGGLFLINAGIEAGVITAGQVNSNLPIDSAVHEQIRPFTVYDINPPSISTSNPFPAPLEANSFGGERWAFHQDDFRASITATDPCSQPLLVGNDAPFLLPLGQTVVTWEALDTGIIGGGNSGRATVTQTITVEDTRPPIILVPPSRVIESNTAITSNDFDIGTAVVFDVADANPTVSNNIMGNSFNPDTRTQVVWTATDSSGNSDSHSQWITVKSLGSNTAPMVQNVSASGLTSEHIDIQLTASDSDFLSGKFDPLMFNITATPANGFFVSPLVPYFIEDYRVKPGDLVGDILNTSNNPSNDLYAAFCDAGNPIPQDFVYRSEFIHVNDNNESYVLDKYWYCDTGSTSAATRDRLSKWDVNGQLLTQIDINSSVKRITLDKDGFVYAVTPGSSSDALFLNKYDAQLNSIQNWKLDSIPSSLGSPRLLGAKMDSQTGLIFATDKRRVYIFDGTDGQFVPAFLGTLKNAENFLSGAPSVAGSSSRGFYIEIDSIGNLYIVDSGLDRIHKFNATTFDGTTLNIGSHIGWMGRCDSGAGCDVPNGRSFGYSCSDATPCEVITANGSNCGTFISGPCSFGNREGQFDEPIGMALDPNDMLYVTDYNNSRVQRFTPLGDFAGVAASTCDGTCFILGDMGMPKDISVNASKFYVLDDQRDLMHVFKTAPFKAITDNSVILTYASDNDFQGTDSFSYVANDGLVNSNTGTATISISRNFRAPEAYDDTLSLNEDNTLNFDLLADDPDGILGVDFNGLDTLSYEIIQQPSHGSISGTGQTLSYTPDANFNGSDSLVFQVTDGMFNSNQATVNFNVQAVNDVPQVQFTNPNSKILPKSLWPLLNGKIAGNNVQAGLGYTLPLMAEFIDPDSSQAHFLQITWGDGIIDTANQNPPADPNNPNDDPMITNTFNSLGQIIAKHNYLSVGTKTIGVTVIDEMGGTSAPGEVNISVIPMVDITLVSDSVDANNLPEPGQPTSLTIQLSNQSPIAPITGLTATNVVFTGTLPVDVSFVNIQTSKGSCSHVDLTSTCQIGNLLPDEVVTIVASMLPDPNFDPENSGYVINATSNEPDATVDNLAVLEIPIKTQHLFLNGFE